jgi:hypothetical protein
MQDKNKNLEKNRKPLIVAFRFSGLITILFGFGLLFDFSNIASELGLTEGGLDKVIGMVLCGVGLLEIIFTERILGFLEKKNRK